jgi:cytochrome c biogenesis protein
MKVSFIKKGIQQITNLKFAIFLLLVIAFISSLGSIIEQDQSLEFYQDHYPLTQPLLGFVTSDFLLQTHLNQIYESFFFLSLLVLLGLSLLGCTFTQQIPIFQKSRQFLFKEKSPSFELTISLKKKQFLTESFLKSFRMKDFFIYQKEKSIYAYAGLIGRLSPILVHFSLLFILFGTLVGGLSTYKSEEFISKGDLFLIQNLTKSSNFSFLQNQSIRLNDFWVESKKNQIKQFYSNFSLLDQYGNEIQNQTISVNNPFHYQQIDFYQNDWQMLGFRIQPNHSERKIESPLFSFNPQKKVLTTVVNLQPKLLLLIFDTLRNEIYFYNEKGTLLYTENLNYQLQSIEPLTLLEPLTGSGILVKKDSSISIIYAGFFLLIFTTFLSYLPYNQFWIFEKDKSLFLSGKTNRGQIQLELDFENFVRKMNKEIGQDSFLTR